MKKFILFILTFAAFLFSLFPTMIAFISILAGKQGLLEFIAPIPPERFWFIAIPLFIITMAASVGSLMLMASCTTPKPKQVPVDNIRYYPDLCVEDPNLGSKLRRLNTMLDTQY
jgi:hypothetical protein